MPLFHLFQFVKGKANSVFQSQKEERKKQRKKNSLEYIKRKVG